MRRPLPVNAGFWSLQPKWLIAINGRTRLAGNSCFGSWAVSVHRSSSRLITGLAESDLAWRSKPSYQNRAEGLSGVWQWASGYPERDSRQSEMTLHAIASCAGKFEKKMISGCFRQCLLSGHVERAAAGPDRRERYERRLGKGTRSTVRSRVWQIGCVRASTSAKPRQRKPRRFEDPGC
jgi:hypothetical protein